MAERLAAKRLHAGKGCQSLSSAPGGTGALLRAGGCRAATEGRLRLVRKRSARQGAQRQLEQRSWGGPVLGPGVGTAPGSERTTRHRAACMAAAAPRPESWGAACGLGLGDQGAIGCRRRACNTCAPGATMRQRGPAPQQPLDRQRQGKPPSSTHQRFARLLQCGAEPSVVQCKQQSYPTAQQTTTTRRAQALARKWTPATLYRWKARLAIVSLRWSHRFNQAYGGSRRLLHRCCSPLSVPRKSSPSFRSARPATHPAHSTIAT